MPKATRSVSKKARHKKWLDRAKGYRGRRSRVFKLAKEAVLKAGQYSYAHRRKRKGQFRQLWQVRINAGARQHGLSYSRLMAGLKTQGVELDRKTLATLAAEHEDIFAEVAKVVNSASSPKK
jgi:large subunit ribosomal protein L20